MGRRVGEREMDEEEGKEGEREGAVWKRAREKEKRQAESVTTLTLPYSYKKKFNWILNVKY